MKLYHFTMAKSVASIVQLGLRANPLGWANCETVEGIKRQRGVWLTELASLHATADECAEAYKQSGMLRRYWLHDVTDNLARISIRIGDNDKRLVRYDSHQPKFARIDQRTWLYLRTITPDKFLDIQGVAASRTETEDRAIAA